MIYQWKQYRLVIGQRGGRKWYIPEKDVFGNEHWCWCNGGEIEQRLLNQLFTSGTVSLERVEEEAK